jgi:hypothetical protein
MKCQKYFDLYRPLTWALERVNFIILATRLWVFKYYTLHGKLKTKTSTSQQHVVTTSDYCLPLLSITPSLHIEFVTIHVMRHRGPYHEGTLRKCGDDCQLSLIDNSQ